MPIGRPSNLTQREVLWRAGFEMGRTLTAYDLQSILALVDGIEKTGGAGPIGIVGSGESGRLALLAAALDPRISAVMIEGTLAPMDHQWEEPIDRTVFGMLREFGTAELVAMIAPRHVLSGSFGWPSLTLTDESGGAPGKLSEPPAAAQQSESARAGAMLPPFADGRDSKTRRALLQFEKPDELLTGFSAVFGGPAGAPAPVDAVQAMNQNAAKRDCSTASSKTPRSSCVRPSSGAANTGKVLTFHPLENSRSPRRLIASATGRTSPASSRRPPFRRMRGAE